MIPCMEGPVHPFNHEQFEFTFSTMCELHTIIHTQASRHKPENHMNHMHTFTVFHSVVIKNFLTNKFGILHL